LTITLSYNKGIFFIIICYKHWFFFLTGLTSIIDLINMVQRTWIHFKKWIDQFCLHMERNLGEGMANQFCIPNLYNIRSHRHSHKLKKKKKRWNLIDFKLVATIVIDMRFVIGPAKLFLNIYKKYTCVY